MVWLPRRNQVADGPFWPRILTTTRQNCWKIRPTLANSVIRTKRRKDREASLKSFQSKHSSNWAADSEQAPGILQLFQVFHVDRPARLFLPKRRLCGRVDTSPLRAAQLPCRWQTCRKRTLSKSYLLDAKSSACKENYQAEGAQKQSKLIVI